ncbi:MAG TPA: SDR family oxidoreductase [Candidatus Binatia bacterium]|jgi:NAD(P)-dependent dehydrogenase (short-subunit alcohol dehydrogenase family)
MGKSLDGKVALVTGGSRGIGKGIAAALAGAGAKVMITSRNAESCEKTAAEIGHAVQFEAGHVGRPEDAERVIQATLSRLGGLDILVNNAATNPYAGPTIDVDIPRWNKTLDTNLTAPLVWIQLAWRARMKERGGSIINISSVGGLATNPILGVYDVTKAALIHLTKQLAAELGPKTRVNAIAPGLIKTDFAHALWAEGRGEQVAKAYPLRRLGEPEDIAEAALFLADDVRSGWMTGNTMVIDGGGLVGFQKVG